MLGILQSPDKENVKKKTDSADYNIYETLLHTDDEMHTYSNLTGWANRKHGPRVYIFHVMQVIPRATLFLMKV